MKNRPPWSLLAPTILVALWTTIAVTSWGVRHGVATPWAVVARARIDFATRDFWMDAGSTALRSVVGVGASVGAGLLVGVALGRSTRVWRACEPTVDFLRSIPPMLVYPLALLAFGFGESARFAAVVFGCTGIVAVPVARALAQVPSARLDTIAIVGLRGFAAARALYGYEALPGLFTGVRLAATAGVVVVVVSEMLTGASHGLGVRAQADLMEYKPEGLWLIVFVVGIISYAVNAGLVTLERRCVHWSGR